MTVAGVDLGATNLRAAVADDRGTVLAREHRPTPRTDGAGVVDAVRETLRAACDAASVAPTALPTIGVGSVGPLDRSAGAVLDPPNLPADRIPLVGPLTESTDAEVLLYNDCTAAAMGERLVGGDRNLVYITLSTGVGAGAVVDGRPLVGRRGNAAELGHVTVVPDGRRCGCGSRGHWEAYCSGTAIPALFADRPDGHPTDLTEPSAAEVFAAAAADDPGASWALDRVAACNARGVAAAVHAFDPETVVLGGAVTVNNPDQVLAPLRERVPDLLVGSTPGLRVATHGPAAVLRGAVAAALTDGTGDPAVAP